MTDKRQAEIEAANPYSDEYYEDAQDARDHENNGRYWGFTEGVTWANDHPSEDVKALADTVDTIAMCGPGGLTGEDAMDFWRLCHNLQDVARRILGKEEA